MDQAYLIGYTFFITSFVIFLCFAVRKKGIWGIIFIGFLARSIFAAIRYHFFPNFYAGRLYPFEAYGWNWAQGGFAELLNNFATGPDFYSWFIGCVYLVVPRSELLIIFINCLFSTLIIYHVYQFVHITTGEKRKPLEAAWVVSLLPFLILLAGIPSREILIMYFVTVGFLVYVKWRRSYKIKYFVLSMVLLLLATAFHGGLIIMLVGIFCFEFYVWAKSWLMKINRGKASIKGIKIGIAIVVIGISGFWAVSSDLGGKLEAFYDNPKPEVITETMQSSAKGRAAYLEGLSFNDPSFTSIIATLPIRSFYFLFSPLPWQVTSPKDLVGLFDSVIYIFLIVGIIRKYKNSPDDKYLIPILLGLLLFVSVFSLGVSNYGTAMRHRAKILPIIISVYYSVANSTLIK